jgi:curved DNA-binding protein CbpA
MYERHWKNYYEILQVSPNAEASVIAAAYKRLAQVYHPDMQGSTSSAKMTDINEAYEILSDPVKRTEYDRAYRMRHTSQPKRKRTVKSAQKMERTKALAKKQKAEITKAVAKEQKRTWTGVIIASVVIAIILIIVGVGWYLTYGANYGRTVITVDDVSLRMGYFLKRCEVSGTDPMYMLTSLTKEEIIKLEAPKYDIKVTPEDIDQQLRIIAGGQSGNITESEFKEWYRQRLNETGLSNSEYRAITATSIMASYLYQYVAAGMSTIVEQVHLNVIWLDTLEDAQKVRARWEAGEDFADLARELSLDANSKDQGGDIGWMPRGVVYNGMYDDEIFSLGTDNVSEPLAYYDTSITDATSPAYETYYLFMVSEKADARQVDEQYLSTLADNAFNSWISEAMNQHEINYHGLHDGFDSETYAWINYQLAKKTGQGSSSGTSSQ